MNHSKIIRLTVLLSGLFSFLPALHAQGWKLMSREEIEAKVHPKVSKQGSNILLFDTCRLSVDTLKEEDSPRTVSFRFRNVSQKPVKITRVKTSCGCTAAEFNRNPIGLNEASTIRLTFHPKNRPGTVDADAWVYTEHSNERPVARLSIGGYVLTGNEWKHLPKSMGHLKLSRKQVVFDLTTNNSRQARIACANSDDQPMKLKALVKPSFISLHTEPAVLQPGQEGDLVITLDTNKLPDTATKERSISLIVEGVVGKPSERTIEVLIKK